MIYVKYSMLLELAWNCVMFTFIDHIGVNVLYFEIRNALSSRGTKYGAHLVVLSFHLFTFLNSVMRLFAADVTPPPQCNQCESFSQ